MTHSPPLSGGKRKAEEVDQSLLETARASARALVSKWEQHPPTQQASYATYGSAGAYTPPSYYPAPSLSGGSPAWGAAAAAAGPPAAQVVQSFTKERVGRIIGPKGSNISVIRKTSGATIKIDSNVIANHQQITFQGTDSEINTAIRLVDELLASPDANGNVVSGGGAEKTELRQSLDKESVGKVIGQAGSVVKAIREGSGAFIKIIKEGGIDNQVLLVTGTEDQVKAAMILVNEALARPDRPRDLNAAPEVKHLLPEAMAARVIGPGGSNIKRVREATGAKVRIGNERSGEEGNQFQELQLAGTEEQVAAALTMINDIIASDSAAPAVQKHEPAAHTINVNVAVSLAGRLIGPKGATIKQIREHSGARIKVHNEIVHSEEPAGSGEQRVEISGTERACQIAYAMVNEITSAGAAESGGRRGGNAAPPPSNPYAPSYPTANAYAPSPYGAQPGYAPPNPYANPYATLAPMGGRAPVMQPPPAAYAPPGGAGSYGQPAADFSSAAGMQAMMQAMLSGGQMPIEMQAMLAQAAQAQQRSQYAPQMGSNGGYMPPPSAPYPQ